MTTYTTITNALVAVGAKPFATTIQALRDNPIAIGEADSTVPAGLLPTVLLGTLTTTSGTTQTLSSLTLTPYKFLMATINGVSSSAISTANYTFAGAAIGSTPNNAGTLRETVIFDLFNGIGFYVLGASATMTTFSITNASTSISISVDTGTFDAGSVRIYGVK